jgi:hypothetical protein
MIPGIGHVHIPSIVDRKSRGRAKPRVRPRTIAASSASRQSGQRRNCAGWINLSYYAIARFRYKHVTRIVYGDSARLGKPRAAGNPIRKSAGSNAAGIGCDYSTWRNLPNGVISKIGDKDVTTIINRNA